MNRTDETQRARPGDPEKTADRDHPGPKEERDRSLLRRLAIGLVAAAAAMFLLRSMGYFLQPVLIALLLCYALWPLHSWLRRFVRPWVSLAIIGAGLTISVLGTGWAVIVNAQEFLKDLPKYQERAGHSLERAREFASDYLPESWLPDENERPQFLQKRAAESAGVVFGAFAVFLGQAGLVGLYVIFMMLEAARFPRAVRRAFPRERAERILDVINSINAAVVEYLSIKVKVNLVVAVPAAVLMAFFGVAGAVLWGVVTFFTRFIPYLGAIVAYTLPVISAAFQFESPVWTVMFAIVLLILHIVGENWVEPIMTGKAIGLPPLVVLLSLAFWDLVWGIVGMILAIPLTVILKIIMERLTPTRPFARLLSVEE